MQKDIDYLVSWCQRMGVELNDQQVHLLHIGKSNNKRPYSLGEGGPQIKVVEQEKDLGVLISNDLKPDKMVAHQAQKAHAKLSQFNSTFTYRGKTWMKLYKTYVKPSLIYASEARRPTSKEGVDKLESVQKRAVRMAGEQGDYKEACRRMGMNTIQDELDMVGHGADMVRTFRIMNSHDKVERATFWKMAEARVGPGRRRFCEKEIVRTVAAHKKAVKKRSFSARVQDPWNQLADNVKIARNLRSFRLAYKKAKNLA